jgi:hypothetical protein
MLCQRRNYLRSFIIFYKGKINVYIYIFTKVPVIISNFDFQALFQIFSSFNDQLMAL